MNPGATEVMNNGMDDDCDGIVDEETINGDDDSGGYREIGGDCRDDDPNISPANGC